MYLKKLFLMIVFALSTVLLTACASLGPADTPHGLINTSSFDPLFLNTAPGNPKRVDYKAPALVSKTEISLWIPLVDTLVVADDGIHVVEWDTKRHVFIHKAKFKFSEIKYVTSTEIPRSMIPNTHRLTIATTGGENIKFEIFNGTAEVGRKIIEEKILVR